MRTINKEEILSNLGHVVVLKGGTSAEREISLISGSAVFNGLQRLGVESSVIDVGETIIGDLQDASPDQVFNMLHGQGGEDGVIQGMLDVMGISYTGSGVLASALAMDKVKSKLLWQQLGLRTADFLILDEETDWQSVIDRLERVVVKPVNGGSSLGISIVDNAEDLQQEYLSALEFDSQVMAEKCIKGKEFSTGVLEDQMFPTIQLETNREFFDFDAKYKDGNTRIICPPRLSEEKLSELEKLIRDAYESLGCTGLARVDLMQDEDGDFYLLEVNTVPGMTEHSFIPMAASQIGIDFDELLLHILAAEKK
ncbi:MAG TPA: D-alanine--D-alanine ligase [Gammaproteobacteria bacterium]|jgi:D-alanine-D-alanine ligase|nr:D-alanine--D-alanine ligase [Gammaproteobacteria bacterium]MDP6732212.1 D-alanine--D-alanine ligase [Gammaproteobacteria bacterium]HAJ77073.1 D-alanine--D-alanine ligase [Gammaproteobacteria bacterium]